MRREHEAVLERMQARLERDPTLMTVRRRTVEHTFGTIMKRVMNVIGTGAMIEALRT